MPPAVSEPGGRGEPGTGRLVLWLLPAVLAMLVLAAHFLRFWALELVTLLLLFPFLLLIRRPWAARLYQAVLVFGALLWARTAMVLAAGRRAEGQPSARLLVILLGVALFTAVAAALFETPALRRRYGLRTGDFFRAAPRRSD